MENLQDQLKILKLFLYKIIELENQLKILSYNHYSMNEQQSQDLTPEEAKASLGMATFLQGQIMPKADPMATEGQETPKSAQGQEQPSEPDNQATPQGQAPQMAEIEAMFSTKLDEMRKELKEDHQREIDGLKEQIQQALTEDNGESN